MKKILSVITIALTTIMVACVGNDKLADEIADANAAISSDDYARAGSICRQILTNRQLSAIPTNDVCDMAVVLVKASEHADTDENIAAALQCYQHAMKTQPDSAMAYWKKLSSEDFQYVFILNNLTNSLTAPKTGEIPADEVPMDEFTDSITE
jgi:hypothetical protein